MEKPYKWIPSNEDRTAGSIMICLPLSPTILEGRRNKLEEYIKQECGEMGVKALLEAFDWLDNCDCKDK